MYILVCLCTYIYSYSISIKRFQGPTRDTRVTPQMQEGIIFAVPATNLQSLNPREFSGEGSLRTGVSLEFPYC